MKKQKSETNVILEDLRSQFKVFREALDDLRVKYEAILETVCKIQEDISIVKKDISVLKEILRY